MYNLNQKEERRMGTRQYLKTDWWRINQTLIAVKCTKLLNVSFVNYREKADCLQRRNN